MLRGAPLRKTSALASGAWIYLLALLAPLAACYLRPLRAALVLLAGLLGYLALTQAAFDHGHIMPVAGPALATRCSSARRYQG